MNVENKLAGPKSVGANEKLETNEEATAVIQAECSGLEQGDSTGRGKKYSNPVYILKVAWQDLLMDGARLVDLCVCLCV